MSSEYIDHEPVEAGRPSSWYRLRKAVRRNRLAVFSAAAVVLAIVVGAMGLGVGFVRERMARADADELRAVAVSESLRLYRRNYNLDLNVAAQAWADNDVELVQQILGRQKPSLGKEDLRGFEWYLLWRLCRENDVAEPNRLVNSGGAMSLSPRKNLLAIAHGDNSVTLLDLIGQKAETLGPGDQVSHPAFAAIIRDGKTLVCLGDETTDIKVVDLEKTIVSPGSRQRMYCCDGDVT